MHARIMLVTSNMNKKSVEILTERCPRLPGCMSIVSCISVETDNHFECNAASATDKENGMRISQGARHIKNSKSTGFEQGL